MTSRSYPAGQDQRLGLHQMPLVSRPRGLSVWPGRRSRGAWSGATRYIFAARAWRPAVVARLARTFGR